jgi:hypothetical protein
MTAPGDLEKEDPPGEDVSPEDWKAAWSDELARRLGRIERGEVEPIDGEAFKAELRGLLSRAST